MEGTGIVIIIGIAYAAMLCWSISDSQKECDKLGGVLVKGASGYACVKGAL